VTWTTNATAAANGGDGAGTAVKARAFSATGAATSSEILVNSVTTGNQLHATVANLADGRVIVSWTDESNALNSGIETRAQILDPRTQGVTVNGTSGIDRYVGSNFADTFRGNGGNDQLLGQGGNDSVDGGAGADLMRGGAANDTYVVENASDVVDEGVAGSSGTDTVQSSRSFGLSDTVHVKGAVENLVLIGVAAINGTGNILANTIAGNGATNVLMGGLGPDSFRFDTKLDKVTNVDQLADFIAADDTILLDNAIFEKLKKEGALKGKFFTEGKKAKDGNDYIVFNPKNDSVAYDKNGDKKGGAVKFAVLPDGIDLTKADFFVV
jgi:Ca2+-binding RTX toxin-like protein